MALPLPLEEVKIQLKNAVSKGIGLALQELKHYLPSSSKKYNELIQLESQLNLANLNQRNGTVSYSDLQVTYNQIRWNLSTLIDSLKVEDFEVVAPEAKAKKSKHGSILYQIPRVMELEKEKRCVVRLAFKEEYLLENIKLTPDTHIESIRIAEVMAVELLDPSAQAAFAIRTLNSPDQFIDEDDYTEWIFMVKPLLEGTYPLVLKVAVIEIKNGVERRREIVLEEMVTITIESVEIETTFTTADCVLQNQINERAITTVQLDHPPAPSSIEPTIAKTTKQNNTLRRYAPILLFLLISTIGSWALDVPQEVNWVTAKWKDTEESFTDYIERYGEEGRHTEEAYFKRAMIDKSPNAFEDYLTQYPKGEFTEAARAEARQLLYKQLLEQYGEINEASETTLITKALSVWKAYQVDYPNSSYKNEIDAKIAKLDQILSERMLADADLAAYQKAMTSNTIEALENYLLTYPNGQFETEVRNQIEVLKQQEEANILITTEEEQVPIASEPEVDLDKVAFEKAVTLEDLRQYLKDFPDGKYTDVVRRKIEALEKALKEEEAKIIKPVYRSFKDSRDGQVYKTVTYNGQTWMAENLNYNAKGSDCYQKNETNCYKYGRLYPWDVAYYACPDGWHLPSDKEWRNFVKQFGGCGDDASDGGRAAFLALGGKSIDFGIGFGGERDAENQFQNLATYANYWTITPYATSNAYYYYFAGSSFQLQRSKSYKKYSFSCRCIKD